MGWRVHVLSYLIGDQGHVTIFTKEDQQLIIRGHSELIKVSLFSTYNTNREEKNMQLHNRVKAHYNITAASVAKIYVIFGPSLWQLSGQVCPIPIFLS